MGLLGESFSFLLSAWHGPWCIFTFFSQAEQTVLLYQCIELCIMFLLASPFVRWVCSFEGENEKESVFGWMGIHSGLDAQARIRVFIVSLISLGWKWCNQCDRQGVAEWRVGQCVGMFMSAINELLLCIWVWIMRGDSFRKLRVWDGVSQEKAFPSRMHRDMKNEMRYRWY